MSKKERQLRREDIKSETDEKDREKMRQLKIKERKMRQMRMEERE